MLNNDYYLGKHSTHGAKIQATVDADGKAIHTSPLIPGRRHDAYLFRNSGLAESMKEVRRGSGRTEITHPALLADSSYAGLDEYITNSSVRKDHHMENYPRRTSKQTPDFTVTECW